MGAQPAGAAITSMVALAFLVPLALATQQIAHDRAVSDAEQQATSLVPCSASTPIRRR